MLQKLKLAPSLAIFLSAAIIWFAPGCQALTGTGATTQPTQSQAIQNVDASVQAFTLVLTGIQVAEQAGLVTPAEIAPYQPELDAIAAALHAAAADAAAGNVSGGQTILDEVNAGLPKLAPLLSKVNARKSATQPSK